MIDAERALWQLIGSFVVATAGLFVVVRAVAGASAARRAVIAGMLGMAGFLWALYAVSEMGRISSATMVAGLALLWGAMVCVLTTMCRRGRSSPSANTIGRSEHS